MLERSEPKVLTLTRAIITPAGRKRIEPSKTLLTGCVYDNRGRKVLLSERASGIYGDTYVNDNPERISIERQSLENISGKSIYLGNLMSHYGHFITETVSTFWYLIDDTKFDHFIFHAEENAALEADYLVYIFNAFDIDISKVLIVNRYIEVDMLTIPERLVQLNLNANAAVRKVYKHILSNIEENSERKIKIYISRRLNSFKKIGRAIINERFIECYFALRGFRIVYPEILTFENQLFLYSQAEIVCGFSGSGLHNCVFMGKNCLLIELGDIRSGSKPHIMQRVCVELSGCRFSYLAWRGIIISKQHRVGICDLKKTFDQLERIGSMHVNLVKLSAANWFFIGCRNVIDSAALLILNLARITKMSLKK